ncbi:Uncharacterised protein [Campylobacter sputorum subsp. bubulus]|uniref:Uncharacterized protein n=1 Tax=Campylobacter sputorum subsp. sputorum TaxID=32024 RepID=A0A381DHF2_9BACT|nr:hypothetical protein CSPUT_0787 [Campylobacter sputorum aubsp. sputorum RM3237]ASM38369.1 hypothetical protein CSPARA_0791 [Campylobacter sputorum bv. paraureolyticus LMG 11764]QEL05206.1 hypothetical protein CSPT_0786 [Campylobacter sputorum subsp. sputorum]SUX09636.1 Uncharacterised protein [Campylobacter sputorum subsp. sputorum]SUX30722.1 Uncharacterised protein [Campylobacter sputorum subsp. bubulus]
MYQISLAEYKILKTFLKELNKSKYFKGVYINKKDFVKHCGITKDSFYRVIGNSYKNNKQIKDKKWQK